MKIVVINRTKNQVPSIPDACTVKLCTTPLEILDGAGREERLVANKSTERTATREMVRRVCSDAHKDDPYKYFVEVDNNLPQNLTIQIGIITPDALVSEPIIVLEKGYLFAGREGVKINVVGHSLSTHQDVRRLTDMLEIARFFGYERP